MVVFTGSALGAQLPSNKTIEEANTRIVTDPLPPDLFFGHNQWKISPEVNLDEIVLLLKKHPKIEVTIEGYADTKWDGGIDRLVAKLRAASVRDRLVEKGVERSRLFLKGYGVRDWICPLEKDPCAKLNHRVHFEIQFPEGIADDLVFDAGRWKLPAHENLDKTVKWLIEHPETDIRIEGYADLKGRGGIDRLVAKLRAASVRDRLVEKGIKRSRLSIEGYGLQKQICLGEKELCSKLNSRVHFVRSVPKTLPPPPAPVEIAAVPKPELGLPPIEVPAPPKAPPVEPVVYYDLTMTKAITYINLENFKQAEAAVVSLLAQYPNDAKANYLLGVVKKKEGDFEASEKAYQTAIRLDPLLIEAALDLAILYYNNQAFEKMLSVLTQAEGVARENGRIAFHQGRAHEKLKQYDRAASRFLRAAVLEPSLTASAYYYAGLSYQQLGLYEEAQESFKTVMEEAPESDFAPLAKKGLKLAKKAEKKARPWNIYLNSSVQYDNNVLLEPTDGPLDGSQGGVSPADARTVIFIQGDYAMRAGNPWKAGFGYTLYQSAHQELAQFDTQSLTPTLYYSHERGKTTTRVEYLYQFVVLNKERYLEVQGLRPSYTYKPGPTSSSEIFYHVQFKDFLETPQSPASSDRDSFNNQAGLSTRISFGKLSGKIDYLFELENAKVADWDFNGHALTVGAEMRLPKAIQGTLNGGYNLKDYKNPNTFSSTGAAREDNTYSTTLRFSRGLTPQSDLALQYAYTKNDSNLSVFDYSRHVYSLSYGWRF